MDPSAYRGLHVYVRRIPDRGGHGAFKTFGLRGHGNCDPDKLQEIVISQAPTEETVKKTLDLLELQSRFSRSNKQVMNGVRQGTATRYDGNDAGEGH